MGIRQARLEGPAGLQLTLFTGKADAGVVAAILPSRRAAKLNILQAIVTE